MTYKHRRLTTVHLGSSTRLDLGATFVVDAGANVVNFPVQLVLDSAHLDSTKLAADASNLRFVDVAAHVFIAYELVAYNPSGQTTVWLQFPALSPSKTVTIGYGPSDTPPPDDNGWSDIHMQGVWHFDAGSAVDSSGQASNMSANATAGADTFKPATGQVLTATRATSNALTIEIEALPDPQSWSERVNIAISPKTSQADFQVNVPMNAGHHKVFDGNGLQQNSWTETLGNGDHVLWTKVHTSNTGTLVAYGGPATPFTEAGYTGVLDTGLTVTRWDGTDGPFSSKSDFDTLFTGLSYDDAALRATIAVVNCPTTCFAAPGGGNNYAALLEGWLILPNGTSYLGTVSDDASDILLGGTDWKLDGTAVVADYGSHPAADSPTVSGAIAGTGDPVRFQYRYNQNTGGHGYIADIGTTAALDPSDIVPTSDFYRRKRIATMPMATVTSTTALGTVLLYGGDVLLQTTSNGVTVTVGGTTLTAAGISAWSHIVITVDGSTGTLWIDGDKKAKRRADDADYRNHRQRRRYLERSAIAGIEPRRAALLIGRARRRVDHRTSETGRRSPFQ